MLEDRVPLGVFTVNGRGTVVSSFFHLHAPDRVVGRFPSGGTRSDYHTDMLGSTRAVVQGAAVTESYDYDPWGVLMPGRTLGSGTKEQFTTKERDAETGLDYFGARYYASAIGRWTSVDPPVAADAMPDWTPYAYVQNNPTAGVDADGRCPIPQLCVAAAVVIGTAAGAAAYQMYDNWSNSRPITTNLVEASVRGLRDGAVNALLGVGMTAVAEKMIASRAAIPAASSELPAPREATISSPATTVESGGVKPLPGTCQIPEGIPDSWRISPTETRGGTRYMDPSNRGNQVRVMQGDPNSTYPNSRAPYVRWLRNGQSLDANGHVVPRRSPEAHIPLSEFRFDVSVYR